MAAEYNGAAEAGADAGPGTGAELRRRLTAGPPLLLDGATGTELERRGHPTGLPLWSTHALLDAPTAVVEIHHSYRAAGAEIITANTFRTQRRTLARAGLEDRDGELTRLAVELARAAGPGWVAGSAPPLEDCYRPDRVPPDATLASEHARHVDFLAEAGVDVVLVETMNTVREAVSACRAAARAGLHCWASFVCWNGATLLSGESLGEALDAVSDCGASAVLVNCLPPSAVESCLCELARVDGRPFGVYSNLGEPTDDTGFTRSEDCSPERFADHASGWLASGARIVGGCCGTSPDHIAAIARRIATAEPASRTQ